MQGNSAAAIGNLSAKADDYGKFNDVWNQPEGGLHGYLVRFLESEDRTFQHIAVWTIVQFLEGGDPKLANSIKESTQILPLVNKLVAAANETAEERPSGEVAIPEGDAVRPSDSISQNGSIGSDDEYGENGEAEIPQLARKILDMI